MTVTALVLLALFSVGAMAWAIGKLSAPVVSKSPAPQPTIDLLMSGPVAAYRFPPKEAVPLSEHNVETPDVDIRIQLARQETKVEGLTQTVEREFARMAEALGKHADAVNNAFLAMKNDFVSKSDFAALMDRNAKIERIVYGACGVILLAVLGALVALVVAKP